MMTLEELKDLHLKQQEAFKRLMGYGDMAGPTATVDIITINTAANTFYNLLTQTQVK